jgi:hypothetical protein
VFGVVDSEKMSRRNSDAAPDAHLARPVDGQPGTRKGQEGTKTGN